MNPASRATWNTSTAHSDVISGSLYEEPITHAPIFRPYSTSSRGVTSRRPAAEIGQEAGLRYVYAGNLPGQVEDYENTYCPTCRTCLIERLGYVILAYRLTETGSCPSCGTRIPGVWPTRAEQVRLGTSEDLYDRRPRPVI